MTEKGFVKLIETAQKYSKELDRWDDFGIELYDLPIAKLSWDFFDTAIEEIFTEEGVDWINWWLYDRVSFIDGSINEAHNPDGSVIPTDTIADLWNLVKDCQK